MGRVGDPLSRSRSAPLRAKPYDRAYFHKWYRDERYRVSTDADLSRRARLAVAVTESLLQRPVRTVLDVGCGEGRWRAALRRVRPGLRYLGVDPSQYAVTRYGRRRGIRRGTLARLDTLGGVPRFDIIICADVLHYLPGAEVRRGLRHIARLLRGVAYLEVFAGDDAIAGDLEGLVRRSARWYRRAFRQAGLTPCGPHCYAGPRLGPSLAALERPG